MVSDKPKPLLFSPDPPARQQFSGWWAQCLLAKNVMSSQTV